LGFRQIIGLTKEDASWITAARGNGYGTIEDIWRRAGIKSATLNRLAEADAFISIGINQREAIWQASAILSNNKLPLFDQDIDGEIIKEALPILPNMSLGEAIVQDYTATKFSLRAHPLSLLRDILTPPYQIINH
jgi:error-prone DNA polymerase